MAGGVTANTQTYVLRPNQMITNGDNGTFNFNPKRIYVPSSVLEEYKANSIWSTWSSKIFAIGGAEWITQFGSSDEYADLTEQEYQDNYA